MYDRLVSKRQRDKRDTEQKERDLHAWLSYRGDFHRHDAADVAAAPVRCHALPGSKVFRRRKLKRPVVLTIWNPRTKSRSHSVSARAGS